MSQEQMQAACEAAGLDWSKWAQIIRKIPAALEILKQLYDLFAQRPPVGAAELGHCPAAAQCCQEQRAALVLALVHNAHLEACCTAEQTYG